ncbi:TetR/AcrR family transcriptional regulator [Oxalicibacterium solurbis]|uniref:Transcriptional regulator n=1 Tax=Oxalicibacterium solurbis TaxID=69280 RepID=A0A8J3F6I8_9BURK|nr:TetR/AcrR family transcriptional regulator [Oxalicibacterium solurbis]GGI55144.1 transcriptional regulator [Oxalicibacterium solurbis]
MPRPANPEVRERLLSLGRQVVHENGYHACGVQDITAAAGIPKGSFYSYFSSKEAFAGEILEAYWSEIEALQTNVRQTKDPLTALRTHFRLIADFHARTNFARGCLIGNLAIELGGSNDTLRAQLEDLFKRWEAAVEAKVAAVLPKASMAERRNIAASLVDAFEGAVMRAKIDRNRGSFDRFDKTLAARLSS